ncbi:MAG: 4-hydroxymandelate oxidase [Cryptosporangiaceae bacterium]|jgi:4-hydroxymandelate oxidase|nr:4-hydroxymandelate oxidase [Cryptosporangiaceae bacterium]
MDWLELHGDWLEEVRQRARDRLPEWFAEFTEAGAGDEITASGAAAAWDRLRLRPRILTDVSAVSTATTVLGTPVDTPILVAPTAMHLCAHPEGEAASAAGTAAAGSLFCLSTRSGRPMSQVAAAGGPWWAQVYVLRDRELTAGYVRRAAENGASALVLTADTPVPGRKPRWEALGVSPELPPGCVTANLVPDEPEPDPMAQLQAADLTPDVIGWLARISGLPIVVKGVLRGDDAVRCADAGADAVYVSNHGGRQLDGAVSTAVALPEVVAALAGSGVEVYADGGIRRGSHALRALALGARAVFLGRPVLWGLAAGGPDGVRDVLRTLTGELEHAMALAGAPTVAHLTPDLVHPLPGAVRPVPDMGV